MVRIFLVIILISGFLIPRIAFTHDAWIEPDKGSIYRILYGEEVPEPYLSSKVKAVKAYGDFRQELTAAMIKESKPALIKADKKPTLILLEFDNGYWTKVGEDYKEFTTETPPQGTDFLHSLKYGKMILKWAPWVFEPMGSKIEIVPSKFRKSPKPGQKLTLQVFVDGNSLPGVMIETQGKDTELKTDSEGKATVTLKEGLQRFSAEYTTPLQNDPKAKSLSLTAILTFVVP